MNDITSLPSSIVNWLNTLEDLKDIKFLTEFPPVYKSVPLKKSIVSVGVEELNITDHFTANDDGVLIRDEYCRTAKMNISLIIHVPFSMGGSKCHEVFTKVVNHLTFGSDLNILESNCEKVVSDRNTDALVMKAIITFTADFCPANNPDDFFNSFLDKELLCGSHIRNSDIHITADERELWNSHFLSGNYTGNGSSTRTITLGFKPKYVSVFPNGDAPLSINFASSAVETYYAFANENGGTNGVEITSNGFKILNGSSYAVGNNTPMPNKTAKNYNYIAIK